MSIFGSAASDTGSPERDYARKNHKLMGRQFKGSGGGVSMGSTAGAANPNKQRMTKSKKRF